MPCKEVGKRAVNRKEIAAFAYRFKKGNLEIMLVTNRDRSRWILPKGQPEAHLSDEDVALMEAYEESGLIGELDKRYASQEIVMQTSRGIVTMHVYVVRIKKLLSKWPEKSFRKRNLVDIDTAIAHIDKQPLRECIVQLAKAVSPPG